MSEWGIFWVCTGLSCVLFALQSVLWTAMRMKKLTVPRWTVLARRVRVAASVLFVAGAAIWIFGGAVNRRAAVWALFGGGFNALIATFHLLTVAFLSGGRAGGVRDRPSPRRRTEDRPDEN